MQLEKFILKCGDYACIRIMIVLHIPLASKEGKFQPQTSIFPVNNNPFSIKPTVVWVEISEKKNISFSSLRSHYKQSSKYKETYFAIRKVLQNFEGHDQWH